MSHPTLFGWSEIEPYATTSAKSRINDQEGALAAHWRLKGCRSMLARNGIPIFWQFSTFGSYRWKKRKYLNYCETLIKASEGRAHLSDRLLSLPPELQAEIMDYLALSTFEDITNPTATTLRSTAQSMLKHLPAIKCEGNTVEPSDALAAIAVEAICKNIPFHFEADFSTPQSPNRQLFSITLAPYVNQKNAEQTVLTISLVWFLITNFRHMAVHSYGPWPRSNPESLPSMNH